MFIDTQIRNFKKIGDTYYGVAGIESYGSGDDVTIIKSVDLLNWEELDTGELDRIKWIAGNDEGTIVAIPAQHEGSNEILVSDDGENFENVTANFPLHEVVYNSDIDRFLAPSGFHGYTLAQSQDGRTWSIPEGTAPLNYNRHVIKSEDTFYLYSTAYNGLYGSNSVDVFSSEDFENWEFLETMEIPNITNMMDANGIMFIISSPSNLSPVTVIAIQNGTDIIASVTLPAPHTYITSISYANGQYILARARQDTGSQATETRLYTSTDLLSWDLVFTSPLTTITTIRNVLYLSDVNRYVVHTYNQTGSQNFIAYTSNLSVWGSWTTGIMPFFTGSEGQLSHILQISDNKILASSNGNRTAISVNGHTWNNKVSHTGSPVQTEKWSGTHCVRLAYTFSSGTYQYVIRSSTDGITWNTSQVHPVSNHLNYLSILCEGSSVYLLANTTGVVSEDLGDTFVPSLDTTEVPFTILSHNYVEAPPLVEANGILFGRMGYSTDSGLTSIPYDTSSEEFQYYANITSYNNLAIYSSFEWSISGNVIRTTPDGVTWTTYLPDSEEVPHEIHEIHFCDGKWIMLTFANYMYRADTLDGPWESFGLFRPIGGRSWSYILDDDGDGDDGDGDDDYQDPRYVQSMISTDDTLGMIFTDEWGNPLGSGVTTDLETIQDANLRDNDDNRNWINNATNSTHFYRAFDGWIEKTTDTITWDQYVELPPGYSEYQIQNATDEFLVLQLRDDNYNYEYHNVSLSTGSIVPIECSASANVVKSMNFIGIVDNKYVAGLVTGIPEDGQSNEYWMTYSSDGITWHPATVVTNTSAYFNPTGHPFINLDNEKIIYITATGESSDLPDVVFETTDGITWEDRYMDVPLGYPDNLYNHRTHAILYNPVKSEIIIQLQDYNTYIYSVFASTDGGSSWNKLQGSVLTDSRTEWYASDVFDGKYIISPAIDFKNIKGGSYLVAVDDLESDEFIYIPVNSNLPPLINDEIIGTRRHNMPNILTAIGDADLDAALMVLTTYDGGEGGG